MEVMLGEGLTPSGEVSTAAPDTSASSECSWAPSHNGDHVYQGVLGGPAARLNPGPPLMLKLDAPAGASSAKEEARHRAPHSTADTLQSAASRKPLAQPPTKSSRGNASGVPPPRTTQRSEDQSPVAHLSGRLSRQRSEDQSPANYQRPSGRTTMAQSGSRSARLQGRQGSCSPPRSLSPGSAAPGNDNRRPSRPRSSRVQGEIQRRGAKISEQLDGLASQKALLEQSMEESERARIALERELQEERTRAAADREQLARLAARLERLEGTGEANSRLRDDNNLLRTELEGHKLQMQEMRSKLETLQREPPTVVFSTAHDRLCEENAQLRRELKESQVMLIKYTQELSEIHENSLKQLDVSQNAGQADKGREVGNDAMLPPGVTARSTESEPLSTVSEQSPKPQPGTQNVSQPNAKAAPKRRAQISPPATGRSASRGRVGGTSAAARTVSPQASSSPKVKFTNPRLVLKGRARAP